MATQVQFRGGTTTEHASFDGAAREVTVDTTKQTLVVQDGSTDGGFPLLRQDLDNLPAGTIDNADVNASAAIAGTKIAPDFGSQNIDTTGNILLDSDTNKLKLGDGEDLQIYHTGSTSRIEDTTSDLVLRSTNDDVIIEAADDIFLRPQGGEEGVIIRNNGAVQLYYDGGNDPKLETASFGLRASDSIYCDEHIVIDNDTGIIKLGTGADLKIYHDGLNSYLKQAGTGDLHIDAANGASADIRMDAQAHIYARVNGNEPALQAFANGAVKLYYDGGNDPKFETRSDGVDIHGLAEVNGNVRPNLNDTHDLGTSSLRWDDVYATNGTINTSDRNEKNTIVDSDLGLSFVNKLKPVSYKFNNKTRTHYGLIAQDVETTLSDVSKSSTDFAGFIKTTLTKDDYTKEDLDTPKDVYGLRYNEFISPLIKAVQELSAEVETLKTKVAALEAN